MFKFHQIGNGVSQGWYCLVDSDEAMEAHMQHMGRRVLMNWRYIKASPEDKEGHTATAEAGAYKTLITLKMEREGKETISFADAIMFLTEIATKAVIEIYHKNGQVYVSKNGACRPDTKLLDGEEILDKTIRKDYIYPVRSKKEYKITRWPGGNHYYILENGNSIGFNGVNKWNTVSLAQDALNLHWGKVLGEERRYGSKKEEGT